MFMKLSHEEMTRIRRLLEIDVKFLTSLRFMDYSLLFAIRSIPEGGTDLALNSSNFEHTMT